MRNPISTLNNRTFDVIVIGAGVNGCSAAQHLTAAGYSVLLVDKGDFASGSSSRSSRLLHCGLRYLAPGNSMWEFARYPKRFAAACQMARQAMASRSQFVNTSESRVRSYQFAFPVYRDSAYSPWQIAAAFKLLKALGPKDVPLDYQRLHQNEVRRTPLLKWLRDMDKLRSIALFREYQFDWPERIALDAALSAEAQGAVIRNYTQVTGLDDKPPWRVTLQDSIDDGESATVHATLVFNMAGIWIDRVNQQANPKSPRKITGTKGAHIVVRLPSECQAYGIASLHRENEPFYCVPWRGLHYFGPTETIYAGDPDDVYTTAEEVEWLLAEANHMLPGANLQRADVLSTWAGVRPLTYDEAQPRGARVRLLHNLEADGMPGMYAMTAGPIMTHRSAGAEVARTAQTRLSPSGPPQPLRFAPHLFPDNQNSPPLLDDDVTVKLADLEFGASHQHAVTLSDLLFRRTGAALTATMAYDAAEKAARAVASVLEWDETHIQKEVADFRTQLRHSHSVRPTTKSAP